MNVMIDLETMGKRPTSAITSIGAVMFNPDSDWIGDLFHLHVSLENCLRCGLTMDADTVLWWLQQSDEARGDLTDGQVGAAPLFTALDMLAHWIPHDSTVWCNGNSFDFAILSHAFHQVGITLPWAYWKERDLRTLKGLNPDIKIERYGIAHSAMHDAINQARHVQRIIQSNKDGDA